MDAVLHAERRLGPWRKRTYRADLSRLPDGTYVEIDGRPWLVWGDRLLAWAPDRYVDRRHRPPGGDVTVLTPPSIVGVLAAGYAVEAHPSATGTGCLC